MRGYRPMPFAVAAGVLALTLAPRLAQAEGDAVDSAYAAGTRAAADGDWSTAAVEWERARSILPQSSPQLSYDLGTAYAHLGQLGYATVHLERARRADAGLSEDAQRNLAIVRRRAEIAAAADSRELSEPAGWGERVLGAFASPLFAWLSMLSGWFAFVAWVLRRRFDAVGRSSSGLSAAVVIASALFVVTALGHAAARDSAAVSGEMIVLHDGLAAREGPGSHQAAAFELQAGSRVFQEERRSGWVMVRLPGGLAGWVRAEGVARIDAPEGGIPVPDAAGTPAQE